MWPCAELDNGPNLNYQEAGPLSAMLETGPDFTYQEADPPGAMLETGPNFTYNEVGTTVFLPKHPGRKRDV